jgi:outer membrane protein FlgP
MHKPDIAPVLVRPLAVLAILGLTACTTPPVTRAVDALPQDPMAGTRMLAEVKDNLDALDRAQAQPTTTVPAPAPMTAGMATPHLTARGFAQVAGQPGQTLNEKRLLAIRAARLDALRDLTEQVHGIRISGDSLLRDAVLRNDTLAAQVQGTLRGARTVSVEPRGDDGYAVTMELDADTLAYIVRAVGAGS